MFIVFVGTISAQQINLTVKASPFKQVLQTLSEQTNYKFVYSDALKEIDELVTASFKNATVKEVFDFLFTEKGISYKITGEQVLLTPKGLVPDSNKSGSTSKQQQKQSKLSATGVVTDNDNLPLIGVTVRNLTNKSYAMTDEDGVYFIDAKSGDRLSFSFIGMVSEELLLGNNIVNNITLETDNIALKDVIVTGYQTLSRERATGSFSKIGAETVSNRVMTNLNQVFSGMSTGIEVKADGALIIRGKSTIYGDSSPLVVVDGFPINGQFASINPNDVLSVDILKDAAAASIYGSRAANGVIVVTTKKAKPSEKLAVSINSFVRIGQKIDLDYALDYASSKDHVEFSERYYNLISPFSSVVNSIGHSRYTLDESMTNIQELKRGAITQQEYDSRRAELTNMDFKDQYTDNLLRNMLLQQHNIGVTGSSEKSSFRLSMMFENDKTSYAYNNNDKFIVNLANTYNFSKNLSYTVSFNVRLENGENNGTKISDMSLYTTPFTQLLDKNGNYAPMTGPGVVYIPFMSRYQDKMPYDMTFNILQEVRERKLTNSIFDVRFQNRLNWKIIDGLNFSAQIQYERSNSLNEQIYNEKTFYTRNILNQISKIDPITGKYVSYFPKGSIKSDQSSLYEALNSRVQLDFSKTIKGKHNITAIIGQEIMSGNALRYKDGYVFGLNERSMVAPSFNYASPSGTYTFFDTAGPTNGVISYPGLLSSPTYRDGTIFKETLQSDRYFSAYLNSAYTYDRKYTASFSLRTDASNFVSDKVRSKFSPFWSVGLSWNIKRETFANNINWLDRLLLRTSYGESGIAAGKTSISTLTTISAATPNESMDYVPINNISARGNPSLTWEKSRTYNAAIDFSAFNNLLYGSVDFYNKLTYDLLSPVEVSYLIQGTQNIIMNGGELRNRGVEISLNSDIDFSNSVQLSNSLNLSFNSNKVLKYDFASNELQSFTGYTGQTYQVGKPMDRVYAFKLGYSPEGFISVIKKDGSTLKVDTPANNPVGLSAYTLKPGESADDNEYLYYQGVLTPKALFGYSTSVKFKNFTLMAIISGKFGHIFKRQDDTEIRSFSKLNYRKSIGTSWDKGDPLVPFIGRPWPNTTTAPLLQSSFQYSWYANLIGQSSYMVEKADHIRLEEIYLGYDLPVNIGSSQYFVNIYTQVKNVGMIWTANGKGIDPDFIRGYSAKPQRLFTLGIKLNF